MLNDPDILHYDDLSANDHQRNKEGSRNVLKAELVNFQDFAIKHRLFKARSTKLPAALFLGSLSLLADLDYKKLERNEGYRTLITAALGLVDNESIAGALVLKYQSSQSIKDWIAKTTRENPELPYLLKYIESHITHAEESERLNITLTADAPPLPGKERLRYLLENVRDGWEKIDEILIAEGKKALPPVIGDDEPREIGRREGMLAGGAMLAGIIAKRMWPAAERAPQTPQTFSFVFDMSDEAAAAQLKEEKHIGHGSTLSDAMLGKFTSIMKTYFDGSNAARVQLTRELREINRLALEDRGPLLGKLLYHAAREGDAKLIADVMVLCPDAARIGFADAKNPDPVDVFELITSERDLGGKKYDIRNWRPASGTPPHKYGPADIVSFMQEASRRISNGHSL